MYGSGPRIDTRVHARLDATAVARSLRAGVTAKVGDRITISGRLTTQPGAPLAGEPILVRRHSPERDGKGQELGPFTTDANGRCSTTVTVDEVGVHSVGAGFNGYGPLGRSLDRADTETTVRVS